MTRFDVIARKNAVAPCLLYCYIINWTRLLETNLKLDIDRGQSVVLWSLLCFVDLRMDMYLFRFEEFKD